MIYRKEFGCKNKPHYGVIWYNKKLINFPINDDLLSYEYF